MNSQMEWRTIVGYPKYEISEFGDIRRSHESRRTKAKRVLKPRPVWRGYLVCAVTAESTKLRKVHRMVAEAFIGPCPRPGWELAHIDGNKTNNHYTNIRWCSHIENERDKIAHGTLKQGEAVVHLAKLTEADVRQVRTRFASGEDIRPIANAMNVTFQNIWCIVHRKTWKHI